MKEAHPKNILEVLQLSTEYLAEHEIENARLNAERLMAHVLNFNRVQLYTNYDRPLSEDELQRFKGYLKRRAQNEPLQYILGETEFMSLPFKVNPTVLIPRPETEMLVEKTIETCRKKFATEKEIKILDVGTGSGCIAISLAKNLQNAQVTALDVSDDALKTATQNARLNQVEGKISFCKFDFLNSDFEKEAGSKFDVITSNPPYISDSEFDQLPQEVKDCEPVVALKNGREGLEFYHKIADCTSELLEVGGFISIEVGMEQAGRVREIFLRNSFSKIKTYEDLTGVERAIICEKRQEDK
ncbi:peptide chain release factor N(5)-glutamine methyltransferase [candidate division KSB1 bacterium]|nr:peptide chain release factor N(5)-glutamine methyltransferase [candidate division KSB1 bacterium]NIR69387.1 peptide chain release factor N(5)-glutamine methyltransferase [candidate division KSB1 bacterium]NIS22737.1 peptide chain release factor N(5)-glutamine methyltransferase [candidate division KSB1 bacterium]NIT69583.1 peptide chain release factor N(5)-glutamine methyltransferase [candidate division KSB1 bacterium]NIU23245.1 peptide chain release factor N(5)-glutamine methyltransferase [c